MNAYELADWMENAIISDDWGELAKYYGWCNQHIPTMLRQQADRIAELEKWEERWSKRCQRQQDRIAELEKLLEHSVGSDCREMRYIQEIENKDARIAELENQSQPVAWMEYIQDEEWEVWYTKPTDLPEGHSYKPLYLAPQTKPLSDEEIISMFEHPDDFNCIDFARAIEERHGIK